VGRVLLESEKLPATIRYTRTHTLLQQQQQEREFVLGIIVIAESLYRS
jgi:hypothetical protein